MVVIGQSVLFWAKVVVFGKNVCIRAKWFNSGKLFVFVQNRLFSGKAVVFWQSSCVRAKWFYSVKCGCVRAKVVVFGQGLSTWAK